MKALHENHMYNIISGRALLESEVEYLIAVYRCFLRRFGEGWRPPAARSAEWEETQFPAMAKAAEVRRDLNFHN